MPPCVDFHHESGAGMPKPCSARGAGAESGQVSDGALRRRDLKPKQEGSRSLLRHGLEWNIELLNLISRCRHRAGPGRRTWCASPATAECRSSRGSTATSNRCGMRYDFTISRNCRDQSFNTCLVTISLHFIHHAFVRLDF